MKTSVDKTYAILATWAFARKTSIWSIAEENIENREKRTRLIADTRVSKSPGRRSTATQPLTR